MPDLGIIDHAVEEPPVADTNAQPHPGAPSFGPPVVETRNVSKSYGDVHALRDASVTIRAGETVALIGPNGAGKSTFVETLIGLRKPDSGSIHVLGVDVIRQPRAHLEDIGVQLQETRLFPRLTPREFLDVFAALYRKHVDVDELATGLGLQPYLDIKIGKLSGGLRQRVGLALALVNDPRLVILDEPTVGLDPFARREFWKLLRQLREQGKTVLFSTHYMEEAQTLADTVIMISSGSIVVSGSPAEIIARSDTPAGNLDDAYQYFARINAART